ncbi:uncharacterized protein LOC129766494 [Toxorhynchites rutilus septentrionalis]|uniref:uncharacterized protein LOC129766494 n=1 Tax=Toxorhynchites rutilus septentrionalis TaxID=329112 RepID=UPI00247A0C3E|nr:uncharacterized protein LOC129766494 [Toxorhynchites rutilus septentrionalis]
MKKIQSVPAPRHDRLETVIDFGLAVQNLVDHLQAAHQESHLSNPMMMQELVEKLPGSLKLDWALHKSQEPIPTLRTFSSFMTKLVTAASEVTFESPNVNVNRSERNRPRDKAYIQSHSAVPETFTIPSIEFNAKPRKICAVCNRDGHRVAECSEFKSWNVDDRWKIVQQKGLCRTCLNNHGRWPCKSWKGCDVQDCRNKHHSLLHYPSSTTHPLNFSINSTFASCLPIFRIIPVVLYNNDRAVTIFAFIDEGSSLTLLEDTIAQCLGLEGVAECLTLRWTGNVTRKEMRSQRVQLEIAGKNSSLKHKLVNARTVSSLVLPSQSLKYHQLAERFPHLRGLPLEDYDSIQPKLLIGLDNLRLGVPLKVRQGHSGEPIAAKCRLGWGIYGSVPANQILEVPINFHVADITDPDLLLNEQLRDYFALESLGTTVHGTQIETEEDKLARHILMETTRRTELGFETGLLWKQDCPNFPNNYPMALRRLQSLEKRLKKEPHLMERVREQIAEYESKEYADKITNEEIKTTDSKRVWYLPLGVVVNPKKPEKVRLIWDAAAKANGTSLNSQLQKGPDLLTPLPMVLCKFRLFPIAVCGDIREMFHQIKIRPQDRQSQRFLWRDNPSRSPQIYVMDVATFGATCSPAPAQYVKNVNAADFTDLLPRAVSAIQNNHYVDDYLDSFVTIQEAVQVLNDVRTIHAAGGFEIRNFLSNSAEVLSCMGEKTSEGSKNLFLERGSDTESVLGMRWIPREDAFTFTIGLRNDLLPVREGHYVPTKREVLKVVMSLFDPLGLVAFFLIHGRILMQDIWATGCDWDDQINAELFSRCHNGHNSFRS